MKARALLIEALVGIASAAVAAGSFCWMVKYTVLKEADMIVIAAFLWLWVGFYGGETYDGSGNPSGN